MPFIVFRPLPFFVRTEGRAQYLCLICYNVKLVSKIVPHGECECGSTTWWSGVKPRKTMNKWWYYIEDLPSDSSRPQPSRRLWMCVYPCAADGLEFRRRRNNRTTTTRVMQERCVYFLLYPPSCIQISIQHRILASCSSEMHYYQRTGTSSCASACVWVHSMLKPVNPPPIYLSVRPSTKRGCCS